MRRREFTVFVALGMFCVSGAARAQLSQAPDIVKQFWAKIAKAKSLTFQLQSWSWEDNRELAPKPYMRLAHTYEVAAQRPNRLAIRGTPPLEYETRNDKGEVVGHGFEGNSVNIQISDGRRSLFLDTSLRTYEHKPAFKTLQEVDGIGESLQLGLLFDKDPIHNFVQSPQKRVNFPITYVLPVKDPPGFEWRMVFDGKAGELYSISYWGKMLKARCRKPTAWSSSTGTSIRNCPAIPSIRTRRRAIGRLPSWKKSRRRSRGKTNNGAIRRRKQETNPLHWRQLCTCAFGRHLHALFIKDLSCLPEESFSPTPLP